MHLTVLGATGATGAELVRQGLERGHSVTAIARDPSRVRAGGERLTAVAGDVTDAASIARAVEPGTVVVSGLGASKGAAPGTLTAGARAVVAAGPERIVWLGAYGTGTSAAAAGAPTRALLKVVMGSEVPDKVSADAAVLAAGGTVLHAGPLSDKPASPDRRTVGLDQAPRKFFPASVSRATVAAAMLDEAETPRFAGRTALPLSR